MSHEQDETRGTAKAERDRHGEMRCGWWWRLNVDVVHDLFLLHIAVHLHPIFFLFLTPSSCTHMFSSLTLYITSSTLPFP
jgi:hypothetical protein